ncbi:ArsR/SmtB family transcription factor [Desulfovibrio ferrophilus]|uniref:Methyltransferase type 11 n=1 Tax=Desulfovibrio ferrophilus TaxID=241368 RepID=A0A2Z6B2F5_9BACT|nr:metalloregulator ArsR/SmtB family transcription factor [Desulfovibrio ferrophilus]BBD09610.1 methyltransferase type 11 [Desulfovibrio ferrophilus]
MSEATILHFSKALADATRLRLARILMDHELSVGEIVAVLGLSQPRISRHLKIMAEAGLLVSRRDGQWVFYGAAESGEGRDYLDAVGPFLSRDDDLGRDAETASRVVAERRSHSRHFFERHAREWDRLRDSTLGGFDVAAEILARMPETSVAADLGCGTGGLAKVLRERASRVIGVDNSQEMLARAREVLSASGESADSVSLRIGDLEHLPLADAEAGFAVMCLALHHLPSPERGIQEALRVLTPGSRFVLVDFEQHTDESLRESAGDHWLGFAPERIEGWLSSAGFAIVENTRFPLPSGLTLRLYEAEKQITEE